MKSLHLERFEKGQIPQKSCFFIELTLGRNMARVKIGTFYFYLILFSTVILASI